MPNNLKNDWKKVKASELMVAAGKPDQAQKFVEQLHYHFENAIPDPGSPPMEIKPMEDFTIERILFLYPFARLFDEKKAGKSRSLTNDSGIVMFSLAEGMVEAAKQAFYAKIPPHPSDALISFYFRINKSLKILSFHPSSEHKDMSPEEEKILSNNRERLSQIYERLYEDHADIFKRDDYTPVIYIISALLERLRNSGRPDGKVACQALDDFVFIMDALNDFETI